MALTLTIGFTRSDRADDYSSFADGYRPGAEQDIVEITVESPVGFTGEQWAEAVFVASNAPGEGHLSDQPGATAVSAALAQARKNGARMRSLSVGDTVTINGVRYACTPAGWEVARD